MADGFLLYRTKAGKEIRSGSLKLVLDHYQDRLNKALEQRSQAAVNAIIRVALDEAGRMWMEVFLPMRFTGYARNLGYTSNATYDRMKVEAAAAGRPLRFKQERDISGGEDINSGVVLAPQPTPFVASGASKQLCLSSARVEVRATKTAGRILIRCQVGVIKFTRQYDAFINIPAIERQRVVDQVRRSLARLISKTGPSQEYNDQFRWTSKSPQPRPLGGEQQERTVG